MTDLIIHSVRDSMQDGELAQGDPGAPTRFRGRSHVSSAHVEPACVRAVGAEGGQWYGTCPLIDDKNAVGGFEDWYGPDAGSELGLHTEFAAAQLLRRNSEGPVPLALFKFRSRQIVIEDLDRSGWNPFEKHPDGRACVRISLPGYSQDGKTALVAVSIAFDQHGSGEYFALRLSNGKWQVVWSDLHIKE